jgi:hypothetical protein
MPELDAGPFEPCDAAILTPLGVRITQPKANLLSLSQEIITTIATYEDDWDLLVPLPQ